MKDNFIKNHRDRLDNDPLYIPVNSKNTKTNKPETNKPESKTSNAKQVRRRTPPAKEPRSVHSKIKPLIDMDRMRYKMDPNDYRPYEPMTDYKSSIEPGLIADNFFKSPLSNQL